MKRNFILLMGFVIVTVLGLYLYNQTHQKLQAPPIIIATTPPSFPSFDLVRLETDGTLVLAGRALGAQQVDLLFDGRKITTIAVNASGQFADTLMAPSFASDSATLELETLIDGKLLRSKDPVILTKSAVLLPTSEGVEVLQGLPPLPTDGIMIDTVSYNENKDIIIKGRADKAAASFKLYADNLLLNENAVINGTNWSFTIPQNTLHTGSHQLRVDKLDATGKVTGRAETGFDKVDLTGLKIQDGKILVQRGNNLWQLSRKFLGTGIQYTIIFTANRDQIRNPDLIYPGQLLSLPQKTNP